jgi:hypothetical protein
MKWRMRWLRNVTCIREMRNAYTILMRKFEGKKPFGRLDWIQMSQKRGQ